MNATIDSTDFNECIALNKTHKSENLTVSASGEDEFFKGLVQRARFYEQFEDRKIKITYSVVQTDIGAFTA
ncbi:hypothetical protein [Methanimicrococcus blatticola]|uniref:Uncharacterized protein n=1 Tax=Methanimicrococcus blatticola TaxID=91560 RepID=A0A484F5S0_9EURY|nr:hypothetical protein [Methanimicrococcus blatticola]MBZ3935039.1 hypothetical protein [Methanimicrococcus blatticola]MCC2508864.1 hypothetical protein [Methanimicrococcus blatticola]TDQ71109.1 hypothetical protein C7391_0209 [Methanimicrococcus blatticola]